MTSLTLLVLFAALVSGLFFSKVIARTSNGEEVSRSLESAVSPILALTTLLLAFVLVQVFSSHNRAKMSAGEEAGKVVGQYRMFKYLDDGFTPRAQAALVCYARAVLHQEWPILAKSRMVVVPEVTYWGDVIAQVLTEIAAQRPGPPYTIIVQTDRDRAEARRKRISETQTAVPEPVSWLMLGLSAVSILAISVTTLGITGRRSHMAALLLLALVFAAMLLAILEIDSKYDGWIRVEPLDLRMIENYMVSDIEARYPALTLPCKENGLPRGDLSGPLLPQEPAV